MPQRTMQREETDTTLKACLLAEAKIDGARQLLLDGRPEAIDGCQSELQQAVAVLEGLVSEGAFQTNSPVASVLHRILHSAHALKLQIEYASKLYFGWIQLRLGAGYTAQGLPVLAHSEPGSCSFEG